MQSAMGFSILALILNLVIFAVVLLGAYFVIRLAVRHALRDHDQRSRPPQT